MPLWLFTYSNFLGLEYEHIAGQYYYLAGSLGVVAGPLLVGLIAQRCAPRALPGMDRAIPPTCALMLLVQVPTKTFKIFSVACFLQIKSLIVSMNLELVIATTTFTSRSPASIITYYLQNPPPIP